MEPSPAAKRRHGAPFTARGMSSRDCRPVFARLAVLLFNRMTRIVSLTDAGRTFVERVGPAMTDIRDAMLAVGLSQTFAVNDLLTIGGEIAAPNAMERGR
jgi:hypothetical protein